MSLGLPSVKVKPEVGMMAEPVVEGPFGIPDPMIAGFSSTKTKLGISHPLEASEKKYHLNQEKMKLMTMRNQQGLHAPLKITMELKAASKVGRLPFLESSNLMHDILTGNLLNMGFEDYLNPAEFCEVAGKPHAVVERSLGLM